MDTPCGPLAASVLSVAVALPPHRYSQSEVREQAEAVFGSDARLRPLLAIFDSCGVGARCFARPLSYLVAATGFGRRNDDFIAAATDLGAECLLRALATAGLERADLDHLVFATTTGIATPSIDALLLHRLGLRVDLERTPLFGSGCAAGAVGLARAADLARARPGAVVGLVTVELCSLTLRLDDRSPKNIVGIALFGDGAACALLRAGGPASASVPRVVAHRSHTFPRSLDIMGWRADESGLELLLSKDLPARIEAEAGPVVSGFLGELGYTLRDIRHFLAHPGGPRVIDSLEHALALPAGTLDRTRRFLRAHGNLSSASVLFVLKDLLDEGLARAGDRGLVIGFGPGFSAELVLLEW